MEKLTFLEVNACGNRQAEKKLNFKRDMDFRISFLMQELAKRQASVISVRDIPWHTLKKVQKTLSFLGYRMFIHKDWWKVKEKWRYTCLTAVFVIYGVEFNQFYTQEKFPTVFRYLAGSIPFAGLELKYKTSHIPCVDDSRPNFSYQLQRKIKMLEEEVDYQRENNINLAMSAGDFNGAFNGNSYGKNELNKFVFKDMVATNTYMHSQIDHFYVSEGLLKAGITIKIEVIDDYYMCLTDHKIIAATIEKAAELSHSAADVINCAVFKSPQ